MWLLLELMFRRNVSLPSSDWKESASFSRMSVLTRAMWCCIPEDGILHSHCHANLKSYIMLLVLELVTDKLCGRCVAYVIPWIFGACFTSQPFVLHPSNATVSTAECKGYI
jgi:hypothetical protein